VEDLDPANTVASLQDTSAVEKYKISEENYAKVNPENIVGFF
jgi:hypothetical protein